MKKIIVILILISSLSQSRYVLAVGADTIGGPITAITTPKDFFEQISQTASAISTAVATPITAAQTTLSTIKTTILDPVKDALTIALAIKNGKQVLALVLGGGSDTALLIQNPGQYVKNKANTEVRVQLNAINQVNGTYGRSVQETITRSQRAQNDPNGQIAALSRSSIPAMVQNTVCADKKLSEIAKNDVTETDGRYNRDAYTARKNELFNSLCRGDPDKDPALARRLNEVVRQRPDLAGSNVLLALTSGDNPAARVTGIQAIISKMSAEKARLAQEDLTRGGGIVSKTECNKWSEEDPESGEKICLDESITHTASQLAASFKDALNLPGDLLKSSVGGGSLISTIAGIVGSIGTIAGMADQLTGGNNTTSSSNSQSYTPANQSYTPQQRGNTSVVTSAPAVIDIPAGSQQKANLLNPVEAQLNSHLSSLSSLKTIDTDYISEIQNYTNVINSGQLCYNQLVTDFPADSNSGFVSLADDQRVITALSQYSTMKNDVTQLRNNIITEQGKIDTTVSLINKTLTDLRATNSSVEFSSIFTFYQNTVDTQNLPGIMAGATRGTEFHTFKNKVTEETQNIAEAHQYDGRLIVLMNTCANIRAVETTRRQSYSGNNN